MATGRGTKWLIGCGFGCGFVVLVLVVAAFVGFLLVKNTVEGIQEAEQSQRQLENRHGAVEDYVPPPDGAILAERLELFIAVRDALAPARTELEGLFADFPPDEVLEDQGSFRTVVAVIRSLGALIKPIGTYITRRNNLLLEHGMSLGEYLYIYSLAYYSWLDHDPEDGPVITKASAGDERGKRLFSGADATFSPRKVRRRYRNSMLAMLGNQMEALEAAGPSSAAWRQSLQSEIDRFRDHSSRRLWADGLPEAVRLSLLPYEEQLAATYSTALNCLEWPSEEDTEDVWRWTMEDD